MLGDRDKVPLRNVDYIRAIVEHIFNTFATINIFNTSTIFYNLSYLFPTSISSNQQTLHET